MSGLRESSLAQRRGPARGSTSAVGVDALDARGRSAGSLRGSIEVDEAPERAELAGGLAPAADQGFDLEHLRCTEDCDGLSRSPRDRARSRPARTLWRSRSISARSLSPRQPQHHVPTRLVRQPVRSGSVERSAPAALRRPRAVRISSGALRGPGLVRLVPGRIARRRARPTAPCEQALWPTRAQRRPSTQYIAGSATERLSRLQRVLSQRCVGWTAEETRIVRSSKGLRQAIGFAVLRTDVSHQIARQTARSRARIRCSRPTSSPIGRRGKSRSARSSSATSK